MKASVMIRIPALLLLTSVANTASAAPGRFACNPAKHEIVFDFEREQVTFDGATGALTQGAATWRGKAGGHDIVVAVGENGAKSVFDVSIDAGRDYSGFVVCRRM